MRDYTATNYFKYLDNYFVPPTKIDRPFQKTFRRDSRIDTELFSEYCYNYYMIFMFSYDTFLANGLGNFRNSFRKNKEGR
jgi:hypothetical protein